MTKRCSKCGESKPLDAFGTDRRRKDVKNPYCKVCIKQRNDTRASSPEGREQLRLAGRKSYQKNKPKRQNAHGEWRRRNPGKAAGYCAKWREKFPEKNAAAQTNWYRRNREQSLADDKARRLANLSEFLRRERESYRRNKPARTKRLKAWAAKNPDRIALYAALRRAALLNRTPGWLTDSDFEQMRQLYAFAVLLTAQTGTQHHVDHELPLRGRLVSGLHVPTNLRVITASENLSKSNQWEIQ